MTPDSETAGSAAPDAEALEGRVSILEMQVQNLQDRTHTLEKALQALARLTPGGQMVLHDFFGLAGEDGGGGK